MRDPVDNEQSDGDAPRSSRIVIPSLEDVMPHIVEASRSGIGMVGSVKSRDLGGGTAIFVLDLGEGNGLLAQLADLPSIYLMLARHMELDAAAFTIADDVMEPTDNWVRVDQPTADSLLGGDRHTIEKVFYD
jgi:hypothetical protein